MSEKKFAIDALFYTMPFLPQKDELDHLEDYYCVEDEPEKIYGSEE